MASAKPTQPPAFDASAHEKVLYDEIRKPDGSGYQVFLDKAFAQWKRWVGGESEFDGTGLRDVVNSNAVLLDGVKRDGDTNSQAILELRADVEALKEAPAARPFP